MPVRLDHAPVQVAHAVVIDMEPAAPADLPRDLSYEVRLRSSEARNDIVKSARRPSTSHANKFQRTLDALVD